MKNFILMALAALGVASCGSQSEGTEKVACERNFEIACENDSCAVVKFTVKLDIDEKLSVPCGQVICNELTDWATGELDNMITYLNEETSVQREVPGMVYANDVSYSEIVDYYGNSMIKVLKTIFQNRSCEELPCGPIQTYFEIKKVWNDDNRLTFKVLHTWDYSGSCGATWMTTYRTIDRNTGKIVKLSEIIPSSDIEKLDAVVYAALMKQKEDLGAMSEEESEEMPFLYFYDRHVDLNDVVSQRGDTLIFMFPPYSVGCGAEGDSEVAIPIAEIESRYEAAQKK